jgi:hypothetical protein
MRAVGFFPRSTNAENFTHIVLLLNFYDKTSQSWGPERSALALRLSCCLQCWPQLRKNCVWDQLGLRQLIAVLWEHLVHGPKWRQLRADPEDSEGQHVNRHFEHNLTAPASCGDGPEYMVWSTVCPHRLNLHSNVNPPWRWMVFPSLDPGEMPPNAAAGLHWLLEVGGKGTWLWACGKQPNRGKLIWRRNRAFGRTARRKIKVTLLVSVGGRSSVVLGARSALVTR